MMKETDTLLGPIVSEDAEKKKEYTSRKDPVYFKTVKNNRLDSYLDEGWEYAKKLKTGIKIQKHRPYDEVVENRMWCLLYKMGFSDLNSTRNFEIKYKLSGKDIASKQIDVFAKDDDTVVIVECKSSEELKSKSLAAELIEFSNLRTKISNSIRNYYGNEFKPKILWFFYTSNIILSKTDIEKARDHRIKIITDREYEYLNQIVNHLGAAARYQFLAEYCEGESIPNLKNKPVPAIKGRLGGRYFYSFVTTPDHLLKIAFVNHRALDDPKGIPTYQRLVQKSRIKQIEQFIQGGGYFPTNILINFTHNLEFQETKKDKDANIEFGMLHLPPKYKTAWIIDGQHRLYGYANLPEEERKQNIFVLAFERLPKDKEAELFVTINHEQKSVPRNLLDDLEGDLKWGSSKPNERIGSIGARVIKNINSDIGEPFYGRLVAQGIKGTDQNNLTVPWIKTGLRESGLVGRSILQNKEYAAGPLTEGSDEETLLKTQKFMNDFFREIEGANPARWLSGRAGLLCTNQGVFGYLLLAASLIQHFVDKGEIQEHGVSVKTINDTIFEYMDPILKFITEGSDDDFFNRFKVSYGATGPKQYYWQLCDLINNVHRDFKPKGFDEWSLSKSQEKVENADKQVKFIQSSVPEYVFSRLKKEYNDNPNYLMLAMNTKTYSKAVEKQAMDVKSGINLSLETYFDFSDVIEIVTHKSNWKYFQDTLAIPRGSYNKTEQTKWMTRVNQLRRNPAHPSPERDYSVDDFAFLDEICEALDLNFEQAGFAPTTAHIGGRS